MLDEREPAIGVPDPEPRLVTGLGPLDVLGRRSSRDEPVVPGREVVAVEAHFHALFERRPVGTADHRLLLIPPAELGVEGQVDTLGRRLERDHPTRWIDLRDPRELPRKSRELRPIIDYLDRLPGLEAADGADGDLVP